jgi:NTP pyrophosphatase (non-canonical NTP hydrolase)
MTGDMYQAFVLQGVEPGLDLRERRLLAGFGLAGEVGEVTEPVKKWAWHHMPEPNVAHMEKELGDVLWYLTLMASTFGLKLNDIMEANAAKLKARYPERHQVQP